MARAKGRTPPLPAETIDAKGKVLGRLATEIATKLLGKDRPDFDPTRAIARPITVVNAAEVALTGNKVDQKVYYRHTGYPGGLRTRSFREQLTIDPTEVIRHAVAGMLPKNRLQTVRMKQLTVLAGEEK